MKKYLKITLLVVVAIILVGTFSSLSLPQAFPLFIPTIPTQQNNNTNNFVLMLFPY